MSTDAKQFTVTDVKFVAKGTPKKDGNPTKKDYFSIKFTFGDEAYNVMYFTGDPGFKPGQTVVGVIEKDLKEFWHFTPIVNITNPIKPPAATPVDVKVTNPTVNIPVPPVQNPDPAPVRPNWDQINATKSAEIKKAQEERKAEHDEYIRITQELIAVVKDLSLNIKGLMIHLGAAK